MAKKGYTHIIVPKSLHEKLKQFSHSRGLKHIKAN
jgi:hypothetical protein